MVMNILAAQSEIQTMVRYLDFPTLDTTNEIPLLVRKAKRQDINRNPPDSYLPWVASTVYALNAIVTPTARGNSYATNAQGTVSVVGAFTWFKCTTAGTSGATEPTWPGYQISNPNQTVVDGTAVWTTGGSAPWTPTWNLAYAIAQGWKMKMSKLVGAYDITVGGQVMKRSQMFEMCKEMQRQWSRRASQWDQIFLQGSLRDRRLFQNITNQNDELFIDGQIQWNLLDEYYAQRGFTGVSSGGQWVDP